jgi:hypothetical protein
VRVSRLAVAVAAIALALGACEATGGDDASPTPNATESPSATSTPSASSTPSPTSSPSASASPTPEPLIDLPPDAPTAFDGALTADGPFEPLVPPGAGVLDAWFQQPDEDLAFASVIWDRGDDPFARELGFVLWERFPDGWRVTHAFTEPPGRGLLGIQMDTGDVTGDGFDDSLTIASIGGSGACAVWRVVAPFHGGATEALKRRTCDAALTILGDHLELREAVFEPGDSHCCPSAFKTTTLEWDGTAFVATDVRESPAPTA